MSDAGIIGVALLALVVVIPLGIAGVVFLVVPAAKGMAWLVRQMCRFVAGEAGDILRVIGAIITSLVLVPLTLVNVLFGRWSSAAHYGRAIESEGKSIGASVYRIALGHPARLFCLTPLTEGLERRIPEAVAGAPGPDRPGRRTGQFDGYTIIGSLHGGGSGGKLYIAEASAQKLAAFARGGQAGIGKVVIKSFSLQDGSTLPQIVRENRALPAANRLGLILEHELTEDRFYYVTRYVPGEALSVITTRLHAMSGGEGLSGRPLAEAVEYAADVVRTLHHYHAGGLWHKDVKPDNIIISDGRAHLVDFGLVTPLRSSLTLTTHGTEYFRDPEMVRMAPRGVKVHEVDGAKFDIYAAGAVLYSMIENSFPAHGGLSQISRRCPEALRWVVRRAMTEYDKRYPSAAAMLADLETIRAASDPFMLKPVDLPSVRSGDAETPVMPSPMSMGPDIDETAAGRVGPAVAGAGVAMGAGGFFESMGRKVDGTMNAAGFAGRAGSAVPLPPPGSGGREGDVGNGVGMRTRPNLRVTSWWTGKYAIEVGNAGNIDAFGGAANQVGAQVRMAGMTAAEQFSRAREQARQTRERARVRFGRKWESPAGVNKGVGAAFIVFMLVGMMLVAAVLLPGVFVARHRLSATEIEPGDVKAGVPVVIAPGANGPQGREAARPEAGERATRTGRGNARKSAAKSEGASDAAVPGAPLGNVLILKESMTFDAQAQRAVDEQLERLEKAGFVLRGSTLHVPDDPEKFKAETDLAADLKSAIGMETFGSVAAAKGIRAWLEEHQDLALVVWIGRDDAGEAQAWIVARAGLATSVVSKASGAMEKATARRGR